MVRLKAERAERIAADGVIFQFQYGAIKSKGTITLSFVFWVFQFQYGAIKSRAFFRAFCQVLDFNSNMVRLKAPFFFSFLFAL